YSCPSRYGMGTNRRKPASFAQKIAPGLKNPPSQPGMKICISAEKSLNDAGPPESRGPNKKSVRANPCGCILPLSCRLLAPLTGFRGKISRHPFQFLAHVPSLNRIFPSAHGVEPSSQNRSMDLPHGLTDDR